MAWHGNVNVNVREGIIQNCFVLDVAIDLKMFCALLSVINS
jgi:hypothetical protein